jgi:hypothetical protein
MRRLLATLLAFLGLSGPASASEPPKESDAITQDLRLMALTLKPEAIGISQKSYPHEVWGILMETGVERGSYTLVVLADGTTSLYFSTGGGIVGAGVHAPVRKASSQFIALANDSIAAASPTDSYPIPSTGQTLFYFLTFHGVKTYSAKEVDLGEMRDKLSNLFHAGHGVITAVRQTKGD